MDALLGSLAEAELMLVRETDPDRLAGLDEDSLIELHTRIRRARNKHVKVYRRQAAGRVAAAGGRGKARPVNARNRGKAEVFENALSAVSGQLAIVAKASADALEAERVEAERVEAERVEAERLAAERSQDDRPAKKTAKKASKKAAKRTAKKASKSTAKKSAKRAKAEAAATALPPVARLKAQRTDRQPDSPDLRKRHASTRATGARRQARRDSR